MKRRRVNLLLAVSLVSGAVAAQSEEEIAAAITRLEGEHLDARAMEFLIDAGKPAVEPLVEALEDFDEAPIHPKFRRMLRVLSAIGPEATDALPALVELMIDDRLHEAEVAPVVLPALNGTVSRLSVFAPDLAHGLRSILVAARRAPARAGHVSPVHSGLIRRFELVAGCADGDHPPLALDSPDMFERLLAVDLIGAEDRAALPQLVAMLEDDEQPRGTAASAMPPEWRRHMQTIANTVVWCSVSGAIARIAPDHPHAVSGLAIMVKSADDPRDRVKAAAALGRHGEGAKDKVDVLLATLDPDDVLLAALDSDDDRLVAEAVTALGMIGIASDKILARLRALTSDDRPAIASRAEAALQSLEGREGDG